MTETGWGEFDIIIKIFFVGEASEKPMSFTHHLKLHPWPVDGSALPPVMPAAGEAGAVQALDAPEAINMPVLSPVHSWQYEEIIFAEPTETFYSLLLSRPPTPLPKTNRHPRALVHALGGGGNFGEFTTQMEQEEGARLDEARNKTLAEIEQLRQKLIGNERDLMGTPSPLSSPGLALTT